MHVLLEIFGWDEVHNNRRCMWICLIDDDVILGQEDRRTILDHRQHFQLMRIAAIDTPLFFLLDYHILMQHFFGSLAIQLRRMHQLMLLSRVHVEVLYLCEVDGTEAALVDLVEAEVREVMDVDVVEDHEVFVWVAVAWLGGHCYHSPDVFELLLLKDEVFLLFGKQVVQQRPILIQSKIIPNQPLFHPHLIINSPTDAFPLHLQTHVSLLLSL